MIKLRELIKESAWDRKFGEPLPTLEDVMEKHGDCGCGSKHECACETKEQVTEDAKQAANKFLQMGIKNVIITLGEKGAYFANNKESIVVPVANLTNPVVDTTGAGDAFNAGLAVAIAEGKNMKETLVFANATAGLSTTKIGTANSMPDRDEIEKFL